MSALQLSLLDDEPPPVPTERGCSCPLYWPWPGLTHCDHCGGAFVINGTHVWGERRAWNEPAPRNQ